MPSGNLIRIGLIGAGAIAQQAYLPMLREIRGLEFTAVVESNESIRAKAAAGHPPFAYLGADLDAAMNHVDAVIICVPNHLHHPIAQTCLAKGKHVLCEKPITIDVRDAETLLRMAEARSLTLTVAHVRRFFPAVKKIKEIITTGTLGALTGFDFREGTVFSWPTVTGFTFDKEKAGGGVLMDIGVHLLDLLFWWIDDEVASFQYADDNLGGLEATGEIQMTFRRGVTGHVKLTRLAVLNNFYTFYFEKGVLSWNPFTPRRIYIRKDSNQTVSIKTEKGAPVRDLLLDFSAAIRDKRPPFIRGEEALQALKFIEACYSSRQAIPMTWLKGVASQ
ncbi:MAG: Gfo/Idh/MocA family oxidoreductase [Deltaproteobacteria bacterium]|nr:Gfo/Idh/MocA family oxidoreductase [Deltaproteobacteria bacterium]